MVTFVVWNVLVEGWALTLKVKGGTQKVHLGLKSIYIYSAYKKHCLQKNVGGPWPPFCAAPTSIIQYVRLERITIPTFF